VLIKPERKGQVIVVVDGGSGKNKHFAMGTWYGVRLTEKKGSSDGRYKGQDPYYFKCPKDYGVFVQAKLIVKKLGDDETFDFLDETKRIEAEKAADDEKYEVGRVKIKALKTAFKELDKDGSLSLEEKEFVPLALEKLGCDDAEAKKLFREIDVSGNGSVSFAEFDAWLDAGGGIDKLLRYADMKKAFRAADKDGNMSLDLAEFVKLAAESMKLDKVEAEKLFKKIDANENGSVCFREFEAYVDDLGGMDNFTVYSQIIDAFKKADADKSGSLDKAEFIKLVKAKLNLSKFKAGKIFISIDKDKDESVSLDEFTAWVDKIGGVKKIQK
jgi:Ca2+-binding EF-hand superfamily protein